MLFSLGIHRGALAPPQAERARRWNARILELLSISPSAIHLQFVWRHLVSRQQHALTPFLKGINAYIGTYITSLKHPITSRLSCHEYIYAPFISPFIFLLISVPHVGVFYIPPSLRSQQSLVCGFTRGHDYARERGQSRNHRSVE